MDSKKARTRYQPTGQERIQRDKQIFDAYEQLGNAKAAAIRAGVPVSTAHYILAQAGKLQRRKPIVRVSDVRQFIRYHTEHGLPPRRIGKLTGFDRMTVRRYLIEAECYQPRPVGNIPFDDAFEIELSMRDLSRQQPAKGSD